MNKHVATAVLVFVLLLAVSLPAVGQEPQRAGGSGQPATLSAEPRAETRRAPEPTEQASAEPSADAERTSPVTAAETGLQGFVGFALPAAVTLAGVGVLVMAIIQLLKDLLPTRRWCQRAWFRRYMKRAASEAAIAARDNSRASSMLADHGGLLRDLVSLAAAGDADALFGLPIEKLTGQLNAAAQSILDNPSEHEGLFRIFTKDARDEDVNLVLRAAQGELSSDSAATKAVVEARSRLFNHIQRVLDAIQISMGDRWTRMLKWVSFVLGFVVILTTVHAFVPGAIQGVRGWIIWLLLSALGGFVAPVARDLVAALQNIRGARA